MRQTNKLLTIAIPTWNRAESVKELLESLIDQILRDDLSDYVEILVSNNGSADNTHEVVEQLKNQRPFITYNKNPFNIGGNPNIMKVMQLASSEYLIFLGDDDRINDDSLQKIIDFLKSNKDIGVVIDSAYFKNKEHNGEISLVDLLEDYYWYIGNAGVFVTRSSFVKENLNRFGAAFFNENWSQTQFMILGLYENKDLKAYFNNLGIISHTLHSELTIYNSFYLWRGTYLELHLSILALKDIIDKETYRAARNYLKAHITQVFYNVLQCGIFIDEKKIRRKTRKHIQKHMRLFSLYENLFFSVIITALSLPISISKSISNIFIFIFKGRAGIRKKNEFARNERNKIREAERSDSISIRKLEFEKDNY